MRARAVDPHRTSLRLGLQTGLLVVGVVAVVGLLLYVVYERAVTSAAEQLLSETTAHIDKADEAAPGVWVAVVTPSGRSVSTAMPEGLPDEQMLAAVGRDGRTRESDLHLDGHDYTVRTAKVGSRVTQAVLDRRETEEERERILTSLLIAGGVGVVLASAVAVWLARRAVRPLADTLAMQRRFVADASHELRTPLTLLSTRVQLLARRARTRGVAPGDEDLAGVLADTRMLTDILDDLLVAADTRASAPREPVDVAELTRGCVESAAASAEHAGLVLDLTVPDEPADVLGVPTALRRAITALVDNAVGHARTRVEVVVERTRQGVAVRVADDGPGIPAEVAPRIFERFTSARAETPAPGGRRHYGIGLALVADVAAAHDGEVAAGPRDDGRPGAVLTLALPAR